MKPETERYLKTARKLMANAAKLHALGFYEDAGRNCYLAGMNAARGLLFEDGFQVTKRHKTLFGALSQALHARDIHDAVLTAFLPTMANLKAIADYETGDDTITAERAAEAMTAANRFVEAIAKITETPLQTAAFATE
jgi:uncharacterized protein (UPF0332 family)